MIWHTAVLASLLLQVPSADFAPATITGIVVSKQGDPVSRAIVSIATPSRVVESVVTDKDGRFAFGGLRPDTYQVTATKAAHLPSAYGARHAGRKGVSIALSSGASITDIQIVLSRGGLVAGYVRGATGEPLAGMLVNVWRVLADGSWKEAGSTTTDDLGEYRIAGLLSGDYVVAALPLSRQQEAIELISAAQVDERVRSTLSGASTGTSPPSQVMQVARFTPAFSGNTSVAAEAQRLKVLEDSEQRVSDLVVGLVAGLQIEGQVVDSSGRPAAAVPVRLVPDGPQLPPAVGGPSPIGAITDHTGRFTFKSVAPGMFIVEAADATSWGTARVVGRTTDVRDLVLNLRPFLTVTGAISLEAPTPTPSLREAVRLTLTRKAEPGRTSGTKVAVVERDGRFTIGGLLPGLYALSSEISGTGGWFISSVIVDGHDVADTGLELNTQSIDGVVVNFSQRRSELVGTLRVPPGTSFGDYCVLTFANEPSRRLSGRRLASAVPSTDGVFKIVGLPSGEYRLGVLTDCDPEQWIQPGFLEEVATYSILVKIVAGARTVQDVSVNVKRAGVIFRHSRVAFR